MFFEGSGNPGSGETTKKGGTVGDILGFLKCLLGGGLKYFLFSPLPGEKIQFDSWVETTAQFVSCHATKPCRGEGLATGDPNF